MTDEEKIRIKGVRNHAAILNLHPFSLLLPPRPEKFGQAGYRA
jgi:hypothetical protein